MSHAAFTLVILAIYGQLSAGPAPAHAAPMQREGGVAPAEITQTIGDEERVVGYRYSYGGASVLIQNNKMDGYLPRIYVISIQNTLGISELFEARAPDRENEVQFISGLRLAGDHGYRPASHHSSQEYKYRGIDVQITGRNSYQTAIIFRNTGKFQHIIYYPAEGNEGHKRHIHACQWDRDNDRSTVTMVAARWNDAKHKHSYYSFQNWVIPEHLLPDGKK